MLMIFVKSAESKKKIRKEYKEKIYWTLDEAFTVSSVSKSVLENIYIYVDRSFLLCLLGVFYRIVCVVIYFSHCSEVIGLYLITILWWLGFLSYNFIYSGICFIVWHVAL